MFKRKFKVHFKVWLFYVRFNFSNTTLYLKLTLHDLILLIHTIIYKINHLTIGIRKQDLIRIKI